MSASSTEQQCITAADYEQWDLLTLVAGNPDTFPPVRASVQHHVVLEWQDTLKLFVGVVFGDRLPSILI
jgi:hypothetical protein